MRFKLNFFLFILVTIVLVVASVFSVITLRSELEARFAQWLEWLKPGGRLFVVQGRSPAMDAVLMRRGVNGCAVESLFETDLPYLVGAAPSPQFIF